MGSFQAPEQTRRYGRFQPKRLDDLRPEVEPIVGKRLMWRWAGKGHKDEPYPDQNWWMPDHSHHAEFGEAATYWAPDEDIEWEAN